MYYQVYKRDSIKVLTERRGIDQSIWHTTTKGHKMNIGHTTTKGHKFMDPVARLGHTKKSDTKKNDTEKTGYVEGVYLDRI